MKDQKEVQHIIAFLGKECVGPISVNEFGHVQIFNIRKKLGKKSDWFPREWPPKKVEIIVRVVK